MKLARVRIHNFRSIDDTGEFEVGDLTCLVGKNESGKTAILEALYGIKPFRSFSYDRTRDYPRRFLNRFSERHPNNWSKTATTVWQLDKTDIAAVDSRFSNGLLDSSEFVLESWIGADNNQSGTTHNIHVDEKKHLDYLMGSLKFNAAERSQIAAARTTSDCLKALDEIADPTEKQIALKSKLSELENGTLSAAVGKFLLTRIPKMFYTSHFERMSGEISINQLDRDKENDNIKVGDQIFLDFIEYAGTSIEELKDVDRYEELKATCEGASVDISEEIFQFWSQNEALEIRIELGEGRPNDPPPFDAGTVAKIRIENRNHRASIPLSERSAGFVWFFSFLSQFKQLRKTTGNAILLLDEPGLTLHGKAQSDLLRYIQTRLLPSHQVIYTTHSPFMIPDQRLEDVRVVEDVIEKHESERPKILGTKVSSDILSVDRDTTFPLQGHLGYEITQSLFVGQNTLLVEGPSDILYIQAFSQALKNRAREGLDPRWTVCPTGGIDKIWSFASLFGGNKLNIAVLCDLSHGDKGKVERLRRSELLKSSQFFTVTDFTGKRESDIEDLLAGSIYAQLVNAAYELTEPNIVELENFDADSNTTTRVVKYVEDVFKLFPPGVADFSHFKPSDWLIRHPEFLDRGDSEVGESLDSFEGVFRTLNELLP